MPLAPAVIAAIIGGGASVAGGALANKGQQQSTSTTMPALAQGYGPLQDLVLQHAMSRLSNPVDTGGFTANGLADNNAAFAGAKKNLANTLTARGLAASPVAGAGAATIESGRAASGARFMNSIPLLRNEIENQNLGVADSVLRGGRGSTSTGTGTQSGGGGAAGAFSNLAEYMGYLTGKGAFKGTPYQLPGYGTPAPAGGY